MIAVEETPAVARTRIGAPYKGLRFFTESDSEIFFGRENERRLIGMTLRASRFCVVYGESGVGKSSLLRAGVVHDLREKTKAELLDRRADGTPRPPKFVPLVYSNWRDDPLPELDACIASAASELGLSFERPAEVATTFDALVERWCAALDTTLVLVLDQFEEYLMYHSSAVEPFDEGLARAVTRRDLRMRIALSIREDALAKLDRYENKVPGLFDNSIRVEHLDRAAGRAAIVGPIERYNAGVPEDEHVHAEDALVEQVLEQVEANEIRSGDAARGGGRDRSGEAIEAPFLQLVMERLWKEESQRASRVLRLATLDELGGAATVVLTHVDQALADLSEAEQAIAAAIFRDLVTPSRQKIAHTPADLAQIEELDTQDVTEVLKSLAERRIVRGVAPAPDSKQERYEIFHDKLADPVLDWRSRKVQEAHEREAHDRWHAAVRRRRRRFLTAALGTAATLVVAVAAWLYVSSTREQPRLKSRALAATAAAILPSDPEHSVAYAAQATREARTPEADAALRSALAASRLRSVVRLGMAGDRVAFADGGRFVVASSPGGGILVWNRDNTGKPLRLKADEGWPPAVSTATSRIVVERFGTNEIWDVSTRKKVDSVPQGVGTGMPPILSADGTHVATTFGRRVTVWQLAPKRRVLVADAGDPVRAVAITRDGKRLALGTLHGTVQFWQAGRGRRYSTSWGDSAIWNVSLSPDAHRLLVVGDDRRAKVYNLQLGREIASIRVGAESAEQSFFSVDGRRAVTIAGAVATVWDTGLWYPIAIHHASDAILRGRFSPDSAFVLTANRSASASVWSAVTGRVLVDLVGHSSAVNDADFTPDGSTVATVSSDRTARVWRVNDAASLAGAGNGHLEIAAFSPDGALIATSGDDARVRLWDAKTLAFVKALPRRDSGRIVGVDFSSRGTSRLATASWDDTARVWNIATGEATPLRGHTDDVIQARFSSDGTRVVTASLDRRAAIWNAATGRRLRWLTGHRGYVVDASFDPTGTRVATASWDGTARIWDTRTSRVLRTLAAHQGGLNAVAFSPDGRLIATGGLDKTARIWDAGTGRPAKVLFGHTAPVWDVTFSADGRRIATAAADATVRIWDVGTGRLVTVLTRGTSTVDSVSFDPADSSRILTTTDEGIAQVGRCATCGTLDEVLRIAVTRTALLREGGVFR